MEESETRRERLKAMRLEADQAVVSSGGGNSLGVLPGLTNPLIESSASQSAQSNSYAAPRFDYYTDPMAAFSGNRRASKVSHQGPQDSYNPPRQSNDMSPTPAHRPNTYSPDPRMFQAQGVHHCSPPVGSPMHTSTPQVNSPGVFSGSNTYSPHPRMFQPQGVYHSSPRGSPMPRAGLGMPQVNPPGVNTYSPDQGMFQPQVVYHSSPRGSPMQTANPYGTPRVDQSNFARGSTFPGPSFPQRGGGPSYNYCQGRGGQRFNNIPSPGCGGRPYLNSGRGRGGSHFSNQSGRGRLDSHHSVSDEVRADRFYNRSMVEDPWDQLKPVIWISVQNTPVSQKPWLPNYVPAKKARVDEDSKKSTSEPSLAEYLAASFNEATDEAPADT